MYVVSCPQTNVDFDDVIVLRCEFVSVGPLIRTSGRRTKYWAAVVILTWASISTQGPPNKRGQLFRRCGQLRSIIPSASSGARLMETARHGGARGRSGIRSCQEQRSTRVLLFGCLCLTGLWFPSVCSFTVVAQVPVPHFGLWPSTCSRAFLMATSTSVSQLSRRRPSLYSSCTRDRDAHPSASLVESGMLRMKMLGGRLQSWKSHHIIYMLSYTLRCLLPCFFRPLMSSSRNSSTCVVLCVWTVG